MPNIEAILRQINKDLVPQFEEKLRASLAEQDKEWLIEQIVRLTLDKHSLEEMDRQHFQEEAHHKRQERAERVKALQLDVEKLREFIDQYKDYQREELIRKNLLSADTAPRGRELITAPFRSAEGTRLLQYAKDMLYGLLFGDETMNTQFQRTHRQLLILTVPRMKSDPLDFMKATTELSAQGKWQDSNGKADERRADNVVLEIEYGEIDGNRIAEGIVTALRLINHLEINEEILYGRIEKVERSTLVS